MRPSLMRNVAVALLGVVVVLCGEARADGTRIEGNKCYYTWNVCPEQCSGTCPQNCDQICLQMGCGDQGFRYAESSDATCSTCEEDSWCTAPLLFRTQECTCIKGAEEY